jgi:Flp pilus assembly protein TadG
VNTHDLSRKQKSRRGSNIVEFAFFVPWFIFLFIGVFDCGFYVYSLISVETAAEQGALYASTSSVTAADSTTACGYALDTLRKLPNVGSGVTTCGSGSVSSTAPVAVTASSISSGADGNSAASVQVMYLTPQLIPIPGVLAGQLTINRTVQFRIRS